MRSWKDCTRRSKPASRSWASRAVSASSILGSMKHRRAAAGCSAEVELPGPLDVAASLEVFRRAGDDLLDRWDGTTLRRTLRIAGEAVPVACTPHGTLDAPNMRVATIDPRHLDAA